MEKENKKKTILLYIIIVLLILIIILMGLYVVFRYEDTTYKNDDTEEKTNKTKEKSNETIIYETTDPKIKSLLTNLLNSGRGCGSIDKYTNDKEVTVNDIDSLSAYNIVELLFLKENKEIISLEEFEEEIYKVLGKNYKFDPESIDYKGGTCPQYNYDSTNKKFVKQITACGWTCGPVGTEYLITKAVEETDTLDIYLKVVFGYNETYYADYMKTVEVKKYNEYDSTIPYEKGSTYKFSFEKEDENFIFVKSVPVK